MLNFSIAAHNRKTATMALQAAKLDSPTRAFTRSHFAERFQPEVHRGFGFGVLQEYTVLRVGALTVPPSFPQLVPLRCCMLRMLWQARDACVWRPLALLTSLVCVTSILYIAIHSHCASLLLDCQCCSKKGTRDMCSRLHSPIRILRGSPYFGTTKGGCLSSCGDAWLLGGT